MADQVKDKDHKEPVEVQNKFQRLLSEARENDNSQVTIGWKFTSDWLREWREFS